MRIFQQWKGGKKSGFSSSLRGEIVTSAVTDYVDFGKTMFLNEDLIRNSKLLSTVGVE